MLVLPKFEDNQNLVREKQYLKEGLEMYKGLKEMKAKEYTLIKDAFYNGTDVTLELIEKSLYYIIETVAMICSKYDIGEVLSFEDSLAYVICKYHRASQKLTSLPEHISEYKMYINQIAYHTIHTQYRLRRNRFKREIEMPVTEITKIIDQKYAQNPGIEIFLSNENKQALLKQIKKLDKKEAEILIFRFGLETRKPMTYNEIGAMFGISKQAAEQKVKSALRNIEANKLKEYITDYCDIVELN